MSIKYPKVEKGWGVSPPFQLTKKVKIVVERAAPGYLDDKGRWHEGSRSDISLDANVQPAKGWDLMIFPESDRSEDWIKIYTAETLYTMYEGDGGIEADIIIWNGKRYQAKNCKTYTMGVLNHTRTLAVRLPVINGGVDA